ncbi:MAG TPA: RNA-binding protein [Flavisolibacter sp.]|nr:RNA-binding protein [Flavisolibacter sp.]
MNIYVSNLSLNIINSDLEKLFSIYGEVSRVAIVRNKINGRSKGSAIIEMPVEAQATQAIMALDQKTIDGKQISVSEIRYKPGEFNN